MNGVNLIDFVMPSAVPTSAGGTKRVGGFKLSLPKKEAEPKPPAEPQRDRVEWWKPLLPLLGILILFKLATWFVRRGKK